MSALTIIALVAAGGLLLAVVCFIIFLNPILGSTPPEVSPPPFKCPKCGSDQIDVFLSGLWDGEDLAGRGTGGTHAVGTCKSCGVHCEQRSVWDNDKKQSDYRTRVLTDAEWQQETAFSMRLRKQQAAWPFVPEGQSQVS